MVKLAYCNDGESVYDSFFLRHLVKRNVVYFLTFNRSPRYVLDGVHLVKMQEPFHPTKSPTAGLYSYLSAFLRTFFLKRYLSNIKPDVSIGCGALFYGFYASLSQLPYILFVWGSDVVVYPRFILFRFMAKYSLKKAKAVIVDSDVQEKACIGLGCDPRKIVRFPWVDIKFTLSHGADDVQISKSLRETLGFGQNDSIVISMRHHEPIYDLECLMYAIPRVVKEAPSTRFLILGRGSLTEKLKRTAVTMGIAESVKFLGVVPFEEVPKYLKMADIYVSTSLSDGTSASLIEAMACGIPTIVTDIPGNREWIRHDENGLLFPTKNSQVLAEDILRLLKDGNFRNTLVAKARKTVLERADWSRNSKVLDDLISSTVTFK